MGATGRVRRKEEAEKKRERERERKKERVALDKSLIGNFNGKLDGSENIFGDIRTLLDTRCRIAAEIVNSQ